MLIRNFHLQTALAVIVLATASCQIGCQSEQPGVETDKPEVSEPAASQPVAADTPQADDDPQIDSFPTFGVSIRRPEEWELESTLQPSGVVGRWLPINAGDDDWTQFSVDVQILRDEHVPLGQIADATLRRLSNNTKYRIDATRIDGERAIEIVPENVGDQPRVPKPSESPQQQPVLGPVVLVERGRLLYKITFLLDDPAELKIARQVVKDIRWQPLVPLFDKNEFGTVAQLFDGKCELTLPKQARMDLTMNTPKTESFIVFDYYGGQDGISMVFELVESEQNTSARQTIAHADMIEERTKLAGALDFRPREDNQQVWNSVYLRGEFPDGQGGTVTRHSRFAVWQVGRNLFVHAQFVVNDEVVISESQSENANKVIDRILASCKVGE